MSNWSGQQQLLSDKPTRRNWYMDVLAHGHVSFRLLDVAAPCWSFRPKPNKAAFRLASFWRKKLAPVNLRQKSGQLCKQDQILKTKTKTAAYKTKTKMTRPLQDQDQDHWK